VDWGNLRTHLTESLVTRLLRSLLIRRFVQTFLALALFALAIGIGARALKAQNDSLGISVEAGPQIFATMCALDAAGFDAEESTFAEMPARLALREDLLKMQGPSTDAIRQFYREHALADSADTLSRYITFALVSGPPPDFEFQTDHDSLPPDVLSIEGFQKLLPNFYKEAHLDIRWARIQPEYEPTLERYRSALRRIVTVSDAYLREIDKPANGRSFTVYVEPLVGTRTNFRNFGDHYSIVVGTGLESHQDAIQHSYLHFMLDRLVLRYRPAIDKKIAILALASPAPQLPVEYHDDFVSFTDECLIKAVELRLRHLSHDQLEAAMVEADQSGFILVRTFVAELQQFEKSEPAMSYYFPDMITGIDVLAEQKRMQTVKFVAAGSAPATVQKSGAQNAQPTELERWLDEGNRDIARRDATAATATFQTALAKYPDDPRAMYGLAISSILSGDGDRAKEIFEKLVAPNPAAPKDTSVLAWSHVYLGRIHDLEDERDQAVKEYRAGLAVDGAPESARAAAQNGIDTAYKAPERPGDAKQPQP
jgi:Tetratricopeptide repeat